MMRTWMGTVRGSVDWGMETREREAAAECSARGAASSQVRIRKGRRLAVACSAVAAKPHVAAAVVPLASGASYPSGDIGSHWCDVHPEGEQQIEELQKELMDMIADARREAASCCAPWWAPCLVRGLREPASATRHATIFDFRHAAYLVKCSAMRLNGICVMGEAMQLRSGVAFFFVTSPGTGPSPYSA